MRRYLLVGLALVCVVATSSGCTPAQSTPTAPVKAQPATAAPTVGQASAAPATPQAAFAPAGDLLAPAQRSGDLLAWLSSTPSRPVRGDAQLDLYLADSTGKPITGVAVTYDIDMTNMSHGPYQVKAQPAADGHYVGRVRFLMPGPWRVITILERPGREAVRMRFEFMVNR